LTHKLLNHSYVVHAGLESFDVATAEYSKIRVTAFARSGSNTNVDVIIRMTNGPEGGYLGELDRFHIKSDGRTSTKL
jgi:hypothetical protein